MVTMICFPMEKWFWILVYRTVQRTHCEVNDQFSLLCISYIYIYLSVYISTYAFHIFCLRMQNSITGFWIPQTTTKTKRLNCRHFLDNCLHTCFGIFGTLWLKVTYLSFSLMNSSFFCYWNASWFWNWIGKKETWVTFAKCLCSIGEPWRNKLPP